GNPDYWDYATLVELALIARREDDAIDALTHALSLMREIWEGEFTARNLVLLRTARDGRGDHLPSAPRGHHDAGRGPLRVPHVGDLRDAGA
ncbi:MAG: TRAFs-binding domain-containing protein, partial [Gammaproteobacteria bacterium]